MNLETRMHQKSQHSEGYSARDVARLVDMPVRQIRAYIRAGLINPSKGPRGEYRLGFRDVVFLRNARSLMGRLPLRKINRGLRKLKDSVPESQDLSAVKITAEGRALLARDTEMTWNLESGQASFDFDAPMEPRKSTRIPSIEKRAAADGDPGAPAGRGAAASSDPKTAGGRDADDWYMTGCELEMSDTRGAIDAYRRAIEREPDHVDARINLGRLLHETGDLSGAEAQCRQALEACPGDVTAAFNLGVVLEDLKRPREAVRAYEIAIAGDPAHADAHYNLARLHEALGDRQSAIRHLDVFRKLIRGK